MLNESEKQAVLDAVIAACTLCQNVRATLEESDARAKDDKSPVTVADFGAQAVVLHALGLAFPEVPAVGEEDASALRGGEAHVLRERVVSEVRRVASGLDESAVLAAIDRGAHEGGAGGRFWTLDPIDGTKGFLRNDQYAVALALIEEGEPVFGILGCPWLPADASDPDGERGCLFVAEKSKGCVQLRMDGSLYGPVRVDEVVVTAEAAFCESVESGHSKHDWAAGVAARLGITKPSLRMDSQCKYAAVARGDASIYLRLPTRPGYVERIWDHAAGWLCVTEAGGHVTDITGAPLDFAQGRGLDKNRGVVATNGHIHGAVIAAIMDSEER